MRLARANRWIRRAVTIPLLVLVVLALELALPLWLVVAAFVSRFVPGRWRILRVTWFAFVYLFYEVVLLSALFATWIASGCGAFMRRPTWIRVHTRLLAWVLRRVMGSARFTFGLRVVPDAASESSRPGHPLLVFSRHAGAGDSFLLVDRIVNGAVPRRPLVVLKDFLQLDPMIDVLLNRIGAAFIEPGSGEAAAEAIARLARDIGPGDALVLFPEGGNFSPERRERAIAKLDLMGRPDLAARAERFTHLLPPRLLGASTAIDEAPGADVLIVGHTGLELLSTPAEIWHNLPRDLPVTTRTWLVPAGQVPAPADRETWLFDAWQEIDEWTDQTMVASAST